MRGTTVMKTVFEKIIDGELPCHKVFENDRIIAFKDIAPAAPVHILIVPKKHLKNISEATAEESELIAEAVLVATELARQFGIKDNFRLLTNNGALAGQSVFHWHFHLIGGRELGPVA